MEFTLQRQQSLNDKTAATLGVLGVTAQWTPFASLIGNRMLRRKMQNLSSILHWVKKRFFYPNCYFCMVIENKKFNSHTCICTIQAGLCIAHTEDWFMLYPLPCLCLFARCSWLDSQLMCYLALRCLRHCCCWWDCCLLMPRLHRSILRMVRLPWLVLCTAHISS